MPFPALAIAGGGALLGGLGSMIGQSSQNRANRNVSNMLSNAWQPVGTTTGAATAGFDKDTGMFSTGLTGPVADWQSQLFQQAMGGPSGTGNELFSQGAGMLTGMPGPIDVNALAGDNLANLRELARPSEERAAGGAIANLLASGRLGSSGGAGMLGALDESNQMADIARTVESLNQARSAAALQDQLNTGMFGRGMEMMNFGNALNQQDFLNSLTAGNTAADLFDLERNAGMFSTNLGGQQLQAAMGRVPSMSQGSSPFGALIGGVGQGMLSRGMDKIFG